MESIYKSYYEKYCSNCPEQYCRDELQVGKAGYHSNQRKLMRDCAETRQIIQQLNGD